MSTPAYASAPSHKKSSNRTLVIVLVAALITAGALLFLQYRQTTQAVESKDAYKAALKTANSALKQSTTDLQATRTQVGDALGDVEHYKAMASDKDTQLAVCAQVVEVADHEQQMAYLAMQASSDQTDFAYGAALAKYNRIETRLDAVQDILDTYGYSDTGDLFEACDPTTLVS